MRTGILLAAACLLPAAAFAEAGRTAAPFLTRPASARAFAMGQAFSAVGGDLESLGYNPAGTAGIKRRAITATFATGLADETLGLLAFAQPTPVGTVSLGVLYFDGGSIGLNLSAGLQETRKVEQDAAWIAAYAVELLPGFSVGGAVKFIQLKLVEQYKADTTAVDAGAQWRTPVKGLSVGGAIQHMGGDVTFEQDGDPLPQTWRAGAAYRFEFGDSLRTIEPRAAEFRQVETVTDWDDSISGPSRLSLLATADAVQTVRQDMEQRIGLELRSVPASAPDTHAAFRLGYAFNRDIDSVSLGFGWKGRRLSVDYALGLVKDLNSQHRVSLGYRF